MTSKQAKNIIENMFNIWKKFPFEDTKDVNEIYQLEEQLYAIERGLAD